MIRFVSKSVGDLKKIIMRTCNVCWFNPVLDLDPNSYPWCQGEDKGWGSKSRLRIEIEDMDRDQEIVIEIEDGFLDQGWWLRIEILIFDPDPFLDLFLILDSNPYPSSWSSISIPILNFHPRSQSLTLISILTPILVLDLDPNSYPWSQLKHCPRSLSRSPFLYSS
jgi:hypothetical protein